MANRKKQNDRKKPNQKKRRFKKIFILEFILLVLLVPIVWFLFSLSKLDHYQLDTDKLAMNEVNNPDMDDYKTIVIFGVDSRANELDKDTRSDSIMVVSIHKKTKKVNLLSVFRDTYVHIEDHGYTKINHAYSYGGPEMALSTINRNFDLKVSDFATINFSALTNAIDALGGITLDIKKDELKHVNAYTRDVAKINGTEYEYLKKPGKQVVNGTQATAYTRVRYTSGGDFTRAERQRTVVQAIVKKAKSTNPITLARVMKIMLPQIKTSLSSMEILSLASSIFFYDIDKQEGFPFDKTTRTINKASVVVPKTLSTNVVKMHEFLFETKDYKPTDKVEKISSEIAAK